MSVRAPEGRQELVLVVEDDPTLRLGLTKTLRTAGFRVEVAKTGMPVTITQATNNNSFAGFALQRPNLVGKPNLSLGQRTPGSRPAHGCG